MTSVRPILIAALAALASAGCALYPGTARPATLEDLREDEGWILLDSVPMVRQVSQKGCGAACLAMVLGHWGFESGAEELEAECAGPGTEGIRATALRDAARRRGLSAYLFSGTVADLEHELARGRPVLVGLAKANGDEFTAHFEVVVGLHPGRERIAALDPAVGLMRDSLAGFRSEWMATKGVMLVVFLPEAVAAPAVQLVSTGGGR